MKNKIYLTDSLLQKLIIILEFLHNVSCSIWCYGYDIPMILSDNKLDDISTTDI